MDVDSPIKILIVDDTPVITNLLGEQINQHYGHVVECFHAFNGEDAIEILELEGDIDILISDLDMPGITGIDLFRHVNEKYPEMLRILLSGYADLESLANALNECDISNFINKPWSRTQLFIIIDSALSKVKLFRENYNLNKSNEKSFFETVSLISDIITELSPQLSEYSRNVGALCVKVAEELKLDNAITQELEIAGELHCLGLLGMSPQIYQTHPHQLSGELRTVYSKYQELSAEMLKAVPRLEAVRKIILLHRENIDGTGPLELKGRQVPFDARVLRLCSHYEAAIFLRRANKQQTLSDMNRKVGTWFDRRCMQALINVITQEIGALIIPIPLKELEPGMKLGKNIYSKTGRMVLSVGATITNLNLKRLLIYNELDPIEEVFIVTSSADKA